ncbi:MAG TPA: alpha/beta fold hydrolase [Granulicella sp.]
MNPTTSQIRPVEDLAGPAGRLEAVLNSGRADAPLAAVVCHPYPPAGGSLHNKVVYNAMKALSALGIPVLRFNFRGVGLSEGSFDGGKGEQDDVRAAIDWLDHNLHLPILLVGFSFGSNVGMRACCGDSRVKGLVGLGLPVRAEGRDYTYGFLPSCTQPKLFICGDHDQFAPRAVMEEVLANAPEPKRMAWVEGAEHFFQGVEGSPAPKLAVMQRELQDWVRKQFGLPE